VVRIRIFHICKEHLTEKLPVKDINTHRSKVALWMFRFFFEFNDASSPVRIHDTEAAGFLHRYFNDCNGSICIHFFVVIQHFIIIHFINMVTGEN